MGGRALIIISVSCLSIWLLFLAFSLDNTSQELTLCRQQLLDSLKVSEENLIRRNDAESKWSSCDATLKRAIIVGASEKNTFRIYRISGATPSWIIADRYGRQETITCDF